jgi:hypothetical protein
VNLGEIEIPEELAIALGNFTMQVWTRQDSGTAQSLFIDALWLVPALDTTAAALPNTPAQTVLGSALATPPKDLGAGDPTWVAGSVAGTAMRMDAVNEAAGWGDNTNGAFGGAGRHQVIISTNTGSGWVGTYTLEVANLTDNTIAASAGTFTTTGSLTRGCQFDGVAGKVYQPRVTVTAWTKGHVDAVQITHTVFATVTQNQRVRSDPGSLPTRNDVEALDSSGNLLFELTPTGTPFWIPPGLSLVWLNELDGPNAGYNENASTLARTMTVTPTVYRRDWA